MEVEAERQGEFVGVSLFPTPGCTSEMTVAESPCAPLPDTDAHIHLSLLDGGSFVGELSKIHAGVSERKFRMYNWAFYISHKGRHILWDLGLDEVRTEPATRATGWTFH